MGGSESIRREREESMSQSETILEIKDLCVEFKTVEGTVHAVDHLSYTLHKGEKLGIVGESGSGERVVPWYDAVDSESSGKDYLRRDSL